MNYIYLVHTTGSVGRNEPIYKIGKSTKKDYERFKGYEKGFRLLFQMSCNDCHAAEAFLKKEFKSKFIHRKDRGSEYFEGDYKIMMDIIYNYIKNEKNEEDDIINTDEESDIKKNKETNDSIDTDENESDESEDDIKEISISNYREYIKNIINTHIASEFPDTVVNKHYIKITKTDTYNLIFYLGEPTDNKIDCICKEINNSIVQTDGNWLTDEEWKEVIDKYLEKITNSKRAYYTYPFRHIWLCDGSKLCDLPTLYALITSGKINLNTVYIINELIDIVNKAKRKITLEFYQDFLKYNKIIETEKNIKIADEDYTEKIRCILRADLIVNNRIHLGIHQETFKTWKEFKGICYDIDGECYGFKGEYNICGWTFNLATIYKINSKYYDYESFIRIYTPYLIRWTSDMNYYLLNREYEFISMDGIKSVEYKEGGEQYIFNGGRNALNSNENFIHMCMSYLDIVKYRKLNKCLNPGYIDYIINIFPLPINTQKVGIWQPSVDYFGEFLLKAIMEKDKDTISKEYAYYLNLGKDTNYKVNWDILYNAYEKYCKSKNLYIYPTSEFTKIRRYIQSSRDDDQLPQYYILQKRYIKPRVTIDAADGWLSSEEE